MKFFEFGELAPVRAEIRRRDEQVEAIAFTTHDWIVERLPAPKPTYAQVAQYYTAQEKAIGDPTRLILVDEADRLRMASLEQMQSILIQGVSGWN